MERMRSPSYTDSFLTMFVGGHIRENQFLARSLSWATATLAVDSARREQDEGCTDNEQLMKGDENINLFPSPFLVMTLYKIET